MGFIINLMIALIMFTVEAMKSTKLEDDDRVGSLCEAEAKEEEGKTNICEVKAYITLYFFLVSKFKRK